MGANLDSKSLARTQVGNRVIEETAGKEGLLELKNRIVGEDASANNFLAAS